MDLIAKQYIEAVANGNKLAQVILLQSMDKDEALRSASVIGCTEAVKLVLEAGANTNSYNTYCLWSASTKGHIETVKLLLEAGADANAMCDEALLWFSKKGHTEVVKLLREYSKR